MESQSIEYKKTWRDEYLNRKETFFFPRAAFRELLLNAVIHKDYLSTTPIQIRIYKDKIRLWNDGALPKEVPVEDLYKEHVSKPCNPNLANVFFKCGMIESRARGLVRLHDTVKKKTQNYQKLTFLLVVLQPAVLLLINIWLL
ncbi:MAG: hypothetical protein L6V90_05990 [Treponema succinifaciens]|nr:MAG: hypothetical protein L6V90_05990 [Treponema succinifaciens]